MPKKDAPLQEQTNSVFIIPLPGVMLAGVPADGCEIEKTLAIEWLAAGLVTEPKADKEGN